MGASVFYLFFNELLCFLFFLKRNYLFFEVCSLFFDDLREDRDLAGEAREGEVSTAGVGMGMGMGMGTGIEGGRESRESLGSLWGEAGGEMGESAWEGAAGERSLPTKG